jgi:hypothetical protein
MGWEDLEKMALDVCLCVCVVALLEMWQGLDLYKLYTSVR